MLALNYWPFLSSYHLSICFWVVSLPNIESILYIAQVYFDVFILTSLCIVGFLEFSFQREPSSNLLVFPMTHTPRYLCVLLRLGSELRGALGKCGRGNMFPFASLPHRTVSLRKGKIGGFSEKNVGGTAVPVWKWMQWEAGEGAQENLGSSLRNDLELHTTWTQYETIYVIF